MSEHRVHSQTGLVDVVWRKDIGAIHLKWYSEYDENDGVQTAVRAALEFVNERHVRNWLVDVSESNEALSEKDYEWVSSDEFRDLVRQSTLERFVLIPPGPNSKQDTSWIVDWEKNTLQNFGESVAAKVSSDMGEIRAFFERKPMGVTQ